MNRSAVARTILILAAIGGLAAGGVFLGTKFIDGGIPWLSSDTQKETAGSGKAATEALKAPDLTASQVIMGITDKKPNGTILSPIMFAKADGGYDIAGDIPFGMTSNIRHETAAIKKESMEAAKKNPRKFGVKISESAVLSVPEMPQIMEGNIYYSHTNGIIPLDLIIMWPDPAVKDIAKWESAFKAAGFKEEKAEEIFNDGKKVRTIRIMDGPDSMSRGEIVTERDIAKKSESMGYAACYLTSQADGEIRKFLDETNTKLISAIVAKPHSTGRFKWRQVLAVPEYRKAGSGGVFNLQTVTLSDRFFPGTSAPLIQSTCELWNSVPIGYSWIMQKSGWEKIKTDVVQTFIGKAASDEELKEGALSSENIFIRVIRTSETGPGSDIVRIDVIDKRTDDKIAVVFDNFGMINVNGLREGVK